MDKYTYIIPGEPQTLSKVVDETHRVWSEYKQHKFNVIKLLEKQHEEQTINNKIPPYNPTRDRDHYSDCPRDQEKQTMIDGPLKLTIAFYMKRPRHTAKTIRNLKFPLLATPHIKPPIFGLLHFITSLMQGIVFRKDYTIVEVAVKKLYDTTPQTIVVVERILCQK